PLNVPVVPPLLSVMVSVSVAAVLGSLIVTPAIECTGASDVVLCPATVPLMVGAPAGSVLITVVLLLTVGVALALLRSLSVNVVVVREPAAPAFGLKTSASSSLFFFMTPPPPRSSLFPYTTLFRSPLNVPVVPPLLSVMVSVSVAPVLG